MARPTKFNQERANRIAEALRVGNTRHNAAKYAGVSYDAFNEWMNKGKADDTGAENEPFRQFRQQVDRAEAECEVGYAAVLFKAALGQEVTKTRVTTTQDSIQNPDGTVTRITKTVTVTETWHEFDWRAAESWLKRRRPAEWGDRLRVKDLDDETLLRLLENDRQD